MGYQYGGSQAPAGAQIAHLNRAIQSKKTAVDHYESRISELKKEDARLRESVRRNKLRILAKEGRRQAREESKTPWPKERVIAAAQPHYDRAMMAHPENATEGKYRMALIIQELKHVELRMVNRRMAPPEIHQEAA